VTPDATNNVMWAKNHSHFVFKQCNDTLQPPNQQGLPHLHPSQQYLADWLCNMSPAVTSGHSMPRQALHKLVDLTHMAVACNSTRLSIPLQTLARHTLLAADPAAAAAAAAVGTLH